MAGSPRSRVRKKRRAASGCAVRRGRCHPVHLGASRLRAIPPLRGGQPPTAAQAIVGGPHIGGDGREASEDACCLEDRERDRRITGHSGRSRRPQSSSERWSGCRDSNAGPPEPHSGALPSCATPRPVESSTAPRANRTGCRVSGSRRAISGRPEQAPCVPQKLRPEPAPAATCSRRNRCMHGAGLSERFGLGVGLAEGGQPRSEPPHVWERGQDPVLVGRLPAVDTLGRPERWVHAWSDCAGRRGHGQGTPGGGHASTPGGGCRARSNPARWRRPQWRWAAPVRAPTRARRGRSAPRLRKTRRIGLPMKPAASRIRFSR